MRPSTAGSQACSRRRHRGKSCVPSMRPHRHPGLECLARAWRSCSRSTWRLSQGQCTLCRRRLAATRRRSRARLCTEGSGPLCSRRRRRTRRPRSCARPTRRHTNNELSMSCVSACAGCKFTTATLKGTLRVRSSATGWVCCGRAVASVWLLACMLSNKEGRLSQWAQEHAGCEAAGVGTRLGSVVKSNLLHMLLLSAAANWQACLCKSCVPNKAVVPKSVVSLVVCRGPPPPPPPAHTTPPPRQQPSSC